MDEIRYKNREVLDPEKIYSFLEQAKTGYLGLADTKGPYVIPLNFVWTNGNIYFHGASEGRKMEILIENPSACFTISEDYGTMAHPIPAHTDTAYMSTMLFGKIELITDIDEAVLAMQKMLDKYVPGYYQKPLSKSHLEKYRSSLGSKTAVMKLIPSKITAKENILNNNMRFYPGRTVQIDL
ncbi:pyridoxamine 5'-phosphate oxidase family protein [Bacillus sp. 03113]|uniref:pyridoxamine 5'-phosphate oxidase family protein n=1 Tax=Bacillus sp. 03113 TaxID=2578211 RepID=UPI001143D9B1|nr:pyridoxamine 5'-phosphate oxidase family protein [Bacillus sp. 03113]